MSYTPIKETKKLLEKIKKCCSMISKYNLNSPCLLQFVRSETGDYDIIISHDPVNGNNLNFYKIFESVTYSDFKIDEEDAKAFELGNDEQTSIPIMISSCKLDIGDEFDLLSKRYDYSSNTFYIFPKFVYKAIKEEVIEGFEVLNDSLGFNNEHTFNINIKLKPGSDRFKALFINNSYKLQCLFNINILPLNKRNDVNSILFNLYDKNKIASYVKYTKEEWEKLIEENKFNDFININGIDGHHQIMLYHNDFTPKKLINIYISKTYEGLDSIVTLYIAIQNSNDMFTYLKYRYYEI